jgi:hypothetical protein
MKSIQVKYHPFSRLPWEVTAKGSHPENWTELTPRQLIAVACTYKGRISDNRFLYFMTGIKPRILKKLDPYQKYKLFELVGFISDLKPYSSFIIDHLEIDGKLFYAPKPRLKGITFGQFIFADSFFKNYQDTNNPKEMTSFLATIYLPACEKFKEELIEQYTAVMEKVDAVTREAIFINYLLIFQWIVQLYPLLFPRTEYEKKKTEANGTEKISQRDPKAWIKVFDSLVGDDIVNQDKYARLPVHNVFRYLTEKRKEAMRSKNKKS